MADKQFKPYDSTDKYSYVGARLAKDPEVRDGKNGKMVRLQVVSTSWREGENGVVPLWVEANVADYFAEAASFMKQNDVLHEIVGKPYMRRFGDNNQMFSFCLDKAQLNIPSELKKTLETRGWKRGGQTQAGGNKPAPTNNRKPPQRRQQRQIQDMPEDLPG